MDKRKAIRRMLGIFMAVVMVFTLWTPIPVSAGTKKSHATTKIQVGESTKLRVYGFSWRTTWKSSDEDIVTVKIDGTVTGVNPGEATVTANLRTFGSIFTGRERTEKFDIVVVEEDTPESETIQVNVGETVSLDKPDNGRTSWRSSNTEVATVSGSGTVTGISAGTVTITATTRTGGFNFWFVHWGGKTTATEYYITVVDNGEIPEPTVTLEPTITPEPTVTPEPTITSTPEPTVTPDPGENQYIVTFDSTGGSQVESQIVAAGETVSVPESPTKEGYMFSGWYEEQNPEDWANLFLFDTPIEKDTILYAAWVDTTTDSDQDGLADDFEEYLGTDPNNIDTDYDGLSDYQEQIIFSYDPLKKDTDSNGISDGDEDFDKDGLSNIWELENNTNPALPDTDNDFLSDYEEINTYNTNPAAVDTDGDGASDGDEIRLGTDPLTPDNQFVEKATSGEITASRPTTVSIEASVTGEQVGTLEIEPVAYSSNPVISSTIPGYLGYGYDISLYGQPQSATLTFQYDISLGSIGDNFQPRVYYYNDETKTLDELPDQEVTNGEVSVAVNHFSTYILLNKVEFDKVWDTEIRNPDDTDSDMTGLDVVFVIDSSGSMLSNDEHFLRVTAAQQFIDKLKDNDRAAVIDFDDNAVLLQDFTSDHELLYSAVGNTDYDGGTDLNAGISKAIEQFTSESYTRTDAYKYIIFLTDGQGSYDSTYINTAIENSITIYTIGLGSGVNGEILQNIAEGTGGKYYFASSADNLPDIYDDVSFETVDYTTDSNNDGISDYYTELIKSGKLTLSNGSLEFMGYDFNFDENGEPSADYDGDGVVNGDELKIKHSGNRVYAYKNSDPTMIHSDSDGLDDAMEFELGTDPLINSYSCDAVDYPLNDENFTYFGVYEEEDEWLNEGSRQIWSTITFNWSHEDESKSLLVSFLNQYSDLSHIQNTTEQIKKEVANLLGEEGISQLTKAYKDAKLPIEDFINIKLAIKRWQAAGNSAKNLSPDHMVQFKAQLGLFKYKYKVVSVWDKIGIGINFAIEETTDVYGWIEAYSSIVATEFAFRESKALLEQMVLNDDAKEKFVTRAAEDILLTLNEQNDQFMAAQVSDLMVATSENVAALALDILSSTNPYILAVNMAIGMLDLITPATEIAEATYCLYVIDELVIASKSLFSYQSKASNYYDINEPETQWIEILILARTWGGEFAKNIVTHQIFSLFNNDEIRQEYVDRIDAENELLQMYLNKFV